MSLPTAMVCSADRFRIYASRALQDLRVFRMVREKRKAGKCRAWDAGPRSAGRHRRAGRGKVVHVQIDLIEVVAGELGEHDVHHSAAESGLADSLDLAEHGDPLAPGQFELDLAQAFRPSTGRRC